jgi:photosystem II stability/assembly factor-like uncharacterized protein
MTKASFLLLLALAGTAGCGSDDGENSAGAGGTGNAGSGGTDAGTGGAGGASGASGATGSGGSSLDAAILAASWKELANAPKVQGKQDDVYFVNPDFGISVNGLGRIHRTSDGGASFEQVVDQPGTYFRAVLMLDESHGFVGNIGPDYYPGVTDAIPLYETNDGGDNWTPVTNITGPPPKGICNFSKLDDQHLFASGRVGGPSFFLKSSDGGTSWTSKELTSQIGMLIDSHFTTPLEGVLLGGTSSTAPYTLILRTTDGGENWTPVFEGTHPGELGWKFSFPSELIGYASVIGQSSPSTFLKTTDGGATWQELPLIDSPYSAKGIGFITENIGWIGGDNPGGQPALRTANGGSTWEPIDGLGPLINRFRFVDGPTGYAIGMTVYKLDIEVP